MYLYHLLGHSVPGQNIGQNAFLLTDQHPMHKIILFAVETEGRQAPHLFVFL